MGCIVGRPNQFLIFQYGISKNQTPLAHRLNCSSAQLYFATVSFTRKPISFLEYSGGSSREIITLNHSVMQTDISRDKLIDGSLQKDYECVHRIFLSVPLIP